MDYRKVRAKLIAAEEKLTWYYLTHSCAITDAAVQRDFQNMIEDLSLGQNILLFDSNELGQPAIYWIGPQGKERTHDYLSNSSALYQRADTLPNHHSYYINNNPIDFLVAKYPMGRVNGVNKAVSLRGLPPAINATISSFQTLAKTRGTLDSICTFSTYDLLTKWAERKQFNCYGNTNYGKDDRDSSVQGTPCQTYPDGNNNKNGGTLTGTMGDKSALDGTCFTPHDLVGNVWEFAIGKACNKYILIVPQHRAAELTFDSNGGLQSGSAEYKKISAVTGALMESSEEGGLLYDFTGTKGSAQPYCISDVQTNEPDNTSQYGQMPFESLTVRGVDRFPLLEQLGLIRGTDGSGNPVSTGGGYVWQRFKQGTLYIELKGGSFDHGSNARLRASLGSADFGTYGWHFGARLELVRKY